jgi:demethylmenaquinone methyltransferase/2-methoxy-6-polyprenyl-1,4-benzoquinol methylase
MLARARQKQHRGRLQVDWLLGDAQVLPFQDRTFDRVLIGFSTRNLTELTVGLQDMLRVVRAGGQLIVLETGWPANRLLRAAYQVFLFTVARAIGLILTGRLWPFSYLARSVRGFLTPAQFIERLTELGAEVEFIPLSGGLASLYIATKRSP